MRWLLRRDTRHARLIVLRLRIRALKYGDDFAETYLAALATVYSLALLCLPGDTTAGSLAWRTIVRITHGDTGLGLLFALFAVPLWLSVLRLVGEEVRRTVLVATFALWVGMAVGFFTGYAWSLGPWLAALNAATAWVAYLRSDP